MTYFKLHTVEDLINNNFQLEKSVICHMKILNYTSNYMNRCSIITISIIKIITRYCLSQFKAAIKPTKVLKKPFNIEGILRMPNRDSRFPSNGFTIKIIN